MARKAAAVAAESVAYVVLQAHGVDSSQYTFNYVAGWATQAVGDTAAIDQVIRATGDRVIAAAHRILTHTQPGPNSDDELVDARTDQLLGPMPRLQTVGEPADGRDFGAWETVPAPPIVPPPPSLGSPARVGRAIWEARGAHL